MSPKTSALWHRGFIVVLAALTVCWSGGALAADRAEPLPKELEGVGLVQRVGAQVPLDLTFTDEQGTRVRLGEFFKTGRPVILDLGYYSCPMLCTLVLNGAVAALRPLPFEPGRDYDLVMVSIDPLETPELARAKKQNYVADYGRPAAAGGWHFLVGQEPNIKRLADAVGFSYRYDPEQRQYAHTAALIILTPEGKVSRYFSGIQFEPRDLRLALAEASDGKIGSALDQVLLFCFHYDAVTGKYTLAATRLVQAGGAATVLILGATLTTWWLRERRRRRGGGEAGAA